MTPRRVRHSKIRKLTLTLLTRFRISEPPVPVAELLEEYGIDLRYGDLGTVSALIDRGSTRTVIGVNTMQPVARQRFAMSHEFGHFLLHPDLRSHADESFRVRHRRRGATEATDVEEVEANFFAAALLMPEPLLDAADACVGLGDDRHVARLARMFQVSSHLMSLRLVEQYPDQRPF